MYIATVYLVVEHATNIGSAQVAVNLGANNLADAQKCVVRDPKHMLLTITGREEEFTAPLVRVLAVHLAMSRNA